MLDLRPRTREVAVLTPGRVRVAGRQKSLKIVASLHLEQTFHAWRWAARLRSSSAQGLFYCQRTKRSATARMSAFVAYIFTCSFQLLLDKLT